MSAPGLAVILSRDGSSSYLGSDDGCRIACPQSLPLSRSVNATYKSLIPDFAMPTIHCEPACFYTVLPEGDRWVTQAASTNNERATSTATGATPPADVANNATIIIEVIPASHGLFYQEQHSPSVLRAPRLRVKDLPDEDEPSSYDLEQAAVEDKMDVDTEKAAPARHSDDAMDVDGPWCLGSATNASDPRGTAHRSSDTSNGKSAANAQAMPMRRMSATVPRSPAPSVISMLDRSVDLKCPFLSPAAPMPSDLFDDTSKKNKD
ncbi:hypothetical protein EV121DRAFT_213165 [Schizophyllum commune]